jgi:hypothetical protein
MRVDQTLTSGFTIRQDFRDSVRFVMFTTGTEGWEFASNVGTAFIANFDDKLFRITCRHVLGDFDWDQLMITEAKFGTKLAQLRAFFYPSDLRGDAVGTDIPDGVLFDFADSVDASFFTDPPYILDVNTAGTSKEGDALCVHGALKEKSQLIGSDMKVVFGSLEFLDRGATSNDPSLREAYAEYHEPEFSSVTGISGGPVFKSLE